MTSFTQHADVEFHGVLFDLDGTLVDTAPDMVAVLQAMQSDHGVDPVAYETGRTYVSNGAIGLLGLGFPGIEVTIGHALHVEYLERYAATLCQESRVFAGLDALIDELEAAGCPWGVVTNKPENLTNPLMEQLGLAGRSACTVSGDTLPVRKPDPAPLLHACDIAGIEARRSIYVGDASRDIEAGRRAGMGTIGATYGYITADDDPEQWGADLLAADTAELARIIRAALKIDAR